jgi:hypothetical protein
MFAPLSCWRRMYFEILLVALGISISALGIVCVIARGLGWLH